jgi:triphosphatase
VNDGADPAGNSEAREGIERELKYRLRDAEHAARYADAATLGTLRSTGRTKQVQVEDRYVDTADGRLAAAGYAARLRRKPLATLLSVKSTGRAASALHQREELEGPADGSLDPRAWQPSAARELVLQHAGDAALVEIATIRQVRRTRILADEAAEVEVSVDEVEIVHQGRVVDGFLELEVELRRGESAALESLADTLAADPDLEAVTSSKLERALAAVAAVVVVALPDPVVTAGAGPGAEPGANEPSPTPLPAGPPKLVVGRTPGVTAGDVLAEAGRKVLKFHLARMIAREEGTRSGADTEDLHSMRVATRRMRAAWRVFGDAFRPKRTQQIRARLREIAGRLGAVRDLDVLIEGLQAHQKTLPAARAAGLAPVIDAWSVDREAARVLLLRTLDARWYERFLEEYRAFVSTDGAGAVPAASPVLPRHVRDTAGSRILIAYEQVRGYEPVLRWADVETLHELRIAAKWLRYTIEFFREALGPEADQLIVRVVALQDHLGWLNDADVSIALTRQFLVERSSTLTEVQADAISDYLHSRERELERLRRSVAVPWRGVSGITFRRLLGRAISAL